MDRRHFIAAVATLAVVPAQKSWTQDRRRRIGVLGLRSRPVSFETNQSYGAFVRGMRDLGYVEGRNLEIEWRFADSHYERLPAMAAELVKLNIEVLVTHATPGTRAAMDATRNLPIVTAAIADPIGRGFAKSLARPGGNLTGLTNLNVDLAVKQVELIKKVLPRVSRVAFMYNARNPAAALPLKDTQAAAASIGVTVTPMEASTVAEVERGFASTREQGIGALIVSNEPLYVQLSAQIIAQARRHRVPTFYPYSEYVRDGGLMGYGENLAYVWERTATYVDKILKGAKPADLPIEQPAQLYLAINRSTAKSLGIAIAQEVLLRADEVIQ